MHREGSRLRQFTPPRVKENIGLEPGIRNMVTHKSFHSTIPLFHVLKNKKK